MTTNLHKEVRRKTLRSVFGGEAGKKLVVMLEPGDIIAIRPERSRTWKRIAIATLYMQLCARDGRSKKE